jgi:hypothetical protein
MIGRAMTGRDATGMIAPRAPLPMLAMPQPCRLS